MPHASLNGACILIVEGGHFTAGYIGAVVQSVGAALTTICAPLSVAEALARGTAQPDVAVLDTAAGIDVVLAAAETLSERSIPFLLIVPPQGQPPALLAHRPWMKQPFAAFQVVERVAEILAASRAAITR